jgi:hypothetical protein
MFLVSEYRSGREGETLERTRTVAECSESEDARVIAEYFGEIMGFAYPGGETFRYRADRGPGPDTLADVIPGGR